MDQVLDQNFRGFSTMSDAVAEATDTDKLPAIAEDGSINPKAKAGTIHQVDPRSLVVIGLDTEDGVEHALYDERVKYPLREALVASIVAKGVLSPVHVRIDDGKAVVVDGRQRVRAAREAAARFAAEGSPIQLRVPVIVVAAKKAAVAAFQSVALNALRQADSFAVTARKAAHLFTLTKNIGEVALAFGISEPVAKKLVSFGENASDALVEAVADGTISASAGVVLAEASEAEQEAAVAEARAPVTAEAAAQGVSEGKAKAARGVGERGRPTGKASKGVKHTVGRKLLKKGGETCPDPEALALLRWIFEGAALPKTHALAKWVGSTMKSINEKGKPGRKAAAKPAAAAAATVEVPAKKGPGRPKKNPDAAAAAPAVAVAAPAAAPVAAAEADGEDAEDGASDADLESLLADALASVDGGDDGDEDTDDPDSTDDDGDDDDGDYEDDDDGDDGDDDEEGDDDDDDDEDAEEGEE